MQSPALGRKPRFIQNYARNIHPRIKLLLNKFRMTCFVMIMDLKKTRMRYIVQNDRKIINNRIKTWLRIFTSTFNRQLRNALFSHLYNIVTIVANRVSISCHQV